MTQQPWRRSSRCDAGACAEVAVTCDGVLMRNSEHHDVVLKFSHAEWTAFLDGAKAGEFDQPATDSI